MATLKTDFINDELSPTMAGARQYNMVENANGTVSFTDVTAYTKVGSNFGATEMNATNAEVNAINENLSQVSTKVNKVINYNGTEKIIGTWFGKDLYEKSFEFDVTPTVGEQWITYPQAIENLDFFVNAMWAGHYADTTKNIWICGTGCLAHVWQGQYATTVNNFESNRFHVTMGSSSKIDKLKLTLHYVKMS